MYHTHDFFICRMVGIARSSVVCFVVDTTGSMSDEIEEAQRMMYKIIESKLGTQDEPSEYIMVPFNDPGLYLFFNSFGETNNLAGILIFGDM